MGWVNFRYLELNGRLKKRLQFPTRERSIVRSVLQKMNLKYREYEPFYNPLYNGYKNQTNGVIHWVDFIVYIPEKRRVLIVMFHPRSLGGGMKERERISFEKKCEYLKKTNKEYIVIPKTYTTDEYRIVLIRKIKSMKGK